MAKKFLTASVLAIATALAAPIAMAQVAGDRGRNEAVMDRPRPEFDARTLRAGALEIRPTLDVVAESNSNVFAAERNEESDTVISLRPRLDANTTWSRHQLGFTASADAYRYNDFDTEDRTNWFVQGRARLDVRRGTQVYARAGLDEFSIDRTAFDVVAGAREPIQARTAELAIGGRSALGRVRLGVEVRQRDFDFDNGVTATGVVIPQNQRDRSERELLVRSEFGLSPDTAIVGQAIFNERDYDRQPPSVATNRDSDGYEALVGFNTDVSKLARGELTIGYAKQDYQDRGVGQIEGFATRGRLEWFPTQLTTVTLNARRNIEEVEVGRVASALVGAVGVRVDHELRRNVILSAGLEGSQADFKGLDRNDDRIAATVGAMYLINRNAELRAGYEFVNNKSDGRDRDRDFDRGLFSLGLRLKI